MNCLRCGKEHDGSFGSGKFCSEYCANKRSQAKLKNDKLNLWLESGKLEIVGRPRGYVREYIEKEQLGLCAICGLKQEWNNKKLVFVLDHINGNAKDHNRNNLRLVCPNCDSQLDTFKRKNKNSKRVEDKIYRKKYYHMKNGSMG
jgi:hypothetical protein